MQLCGSLSILWHCLSLRLDNVIQTKKRIWAYLVLLQFADTAFFFFFNKLKVCGNPVLNKSIGAIFPTAFGCFVSLFHILLILRVFQIFHYYYFSYGDLLSLMLLLQKITTH